MGDVLLGKKRWRCHLPLPGVPVLPTAHQLTLSLLDPWDPTRKIFCDVEQNVRCSAKDWIKCDSIEGYVTCHTWFLCFLAADSTQRYVGLWLDHIYGHVEMTINFQNTPKIVYTIEQQLSSLNDQSDVPIAWNISRPNDKWCLLIEDYVAVYDSGNRTRPVFTRGVKAKKLTCFQSIHFPVRPTLLSLRGGTND